MTVDSEDDVAALQRIGAIVADTLYHMANNIEPEMTTKELDDIGREYMERHGARSAPELTYNYPGATCISVNECIAHGIPGDIVIEAGDLVNIDVSAELGGYFGDTGASFIVPPGTAEQKRVCSAAKKARNFVISRLKAGTPVNRIGKMVEKIARQTDMKIVQNLTSHGIGKALHEEPKTILSYYDEDERRTLADGAVITIEPFLSNRAVWATEGNDEWSLYNEVEAVTAQYEHTIIITRGKPIITTLPREYAA